MVYHTCLSVNTVHYSIPRLYLTNFVSDRDVNVILNSNKSGDIRITCPCDLYPFTPHFYIVKLGFTGVYIIFLFLL